MARRLLLGSLICCTFMLVGCGDQITHSRNARSEGLEFFRQRQYELAAGSFRSAVKQQPRDIESHYYLGRCYEALGSYKQATVAYEVAFEGQKLGLKRHSDQKFRHQIIDGLARSIAKGNQRDAKIDQVAQQVRLEGRSDDYLLLAKIYRYSLDADAALKGYADAVRVAPDDADIVAEYGLYLKDLGQKPQAIQMLTRAYRLDDSDEAVQKALRELEVVPGPSLKETDELAEPDIPAGPLPDFTSDRNRTRD